MCIFEDPCVLFGTDIPIFFVLLGGYILLMLLFKSLAMSSETIFDVLNRII